MTDRVLIVSPFPPPYGGIASYSEDLVDGLRGSGLPVACYDTSRYERLRLAPPGDERGYLRILNPRNALFLLALLFDWIPYSLAIARHRPGVVHVHTASGWAWWRSVAYVLWARILGCRGILHVHNAVDSFYTNECGPVFKLIVRLSLRVPHHLITLSNGIRDFLLDITPTGITAIYNGLQVADFQADKNYEPPFRMLFAGAVGHQKGVDDLLRALAQSNMPASQLTLTVMGSGHVEEMAALAESLGLSDQVRFTGRVSDEEKVGLFKSHHILALPSYAEGQPIAILEGMASGMAILSTTVGSIPEIITNGKNGYLVKPGDVAALDRNIKALADVEACRSIGMRNAETAVDRYDFPRVVKEVIATYDRTCGSDGSWRIG